MGTFLLNPKTWLQLTWHWKQQSHETKLRSANEELKDEGQWTWTDFVKSEDWNLHASEAELKFWKQILSFYPEAHPLLGGILLPC